MTPCPLCGETRRLGPDGVCSWRAGCEHRAMVAEAREAELQRMIDVARNHWSGGGLTIAGVPLEQQCWQVEAWRAWSGLPENDWPWE